MDKKSKSAPIIGISVGDINGIGPEVTIKTFSDNRMLKYLTPVIYGSSKSISFYRKSLGLDKFNYHQARDISQINPRKVNVINAWDDAVEIKPGEVNDDGGRFAAKSLMSATEDLKAGRLNAIVTAPINKKNIQSEDFDFPGHTEYFTKTFEAKESLMLLVSDNLKVGVVTGHIPLKKVADNVTKDTLTKKITILESTLKKDFGIKKPRIAVLGLNPHAGDDGLLGTEDERVIAPVIQEFRDRGKLVFGPYPADGFFGALQYQKFDAVLAMYHDQGLVPFKTIAFQTGVNFTAGLSVVRTSPDHGTAYDLAGKQSADETSMRSAVLLAAQILKNRSESGQ